LAVSEITDGIIVINRLKSHTALTGELQSGLTKACVVGLGGPSGAKQFHSLGTKELPRALREIGAMVIEKSPIIGGWPSLRMVMKKPHMYNLC
jgi:hypothetical protein